MTQQTWRARLAPLGKAVRLSAPASEGRVEALAGALGVSVPAELRALLLETDGVADRTGARVVWPADEIARQNREFRTKAEFRQLYMPFDSLLFFGEAGNGDQFFFRVLDGLVRDADVYVWEHETDNRVWIAPSLEPFLVRWLAEADER